MARRTSGRWLSAYADTVTESLRTITVPAATTVTLGDRAVAALTTEFTRLGGPKTGLVIGAVPGSPVLLAAIDALTPDDQLTVTASAGVADALRAQITGRGTWVADRVRVIESLAEADPADVVIFAEPLTGPADAARQLLDEVGKHLAEGAVLTVATIAAPGLTDGASAELTRQSSFYGVGTDLVIRNRPPVRVHRLRYGAAPAAIADRAPARGAAV